MPAGADRGRRARQQRTCGSGGRLPRERAELARAAARPETEGLAGRPGAGRRRWGFGPIEGLAPSVPARAQRCWVHKTRNLLDKLPKGVQARAKRNLQQIWMAETQEAGRAWQHFVAAYEAKYEKAVECLAKDRDDLLAFYDYPAEHWRYLRTTNPIESVFATVRLRTVKTRGCLSRKTAFAMVLQLVLSAQEKCRRLNGPKRLAQVIEGVQFRNGIQEVRRAA